MNVSMPFSDFDHRTLDNIFDLAEVVKDAWSDLESPDIRGQMYCPSCGDKRRMVVSKQYSHGSAILRAKSGMEVVNDIVPMLMTFSCVQCDSKFSVLVHKESGGVSLAIFPEGRGTLATPHTPNAVVYYLDQVQKCWSIGAFSAAISMYRVALDHLLYGEGFRKGMVGQKVEVLEKAIESGTAPDWARDLNTRYLEVLNKLATYALHPNEGDVTPQLVFDQDLLVAVKATFQELLVRVFELPHQQEDRLTTLEGALRRLGTT